MKRRPSYRTIPLLIAAIASAHGSAQETSPVETVQRVDIKSGAYDARRDDTASRIVIRREEVTRYGDRSVLDVLKRVPGVTIDGSGGRGGTIQMRGLGAYTQVLVNGERVPSGFSFDSLSPDVIERIEVLRAATADLSTQGVAGTINIILRRASGKAERQFKLGMLQSSLFRGPSSSFRLSDKAGDVAYSLAADLQLERFSRVWNGVEENIAIDGALDRRRLTTTPERGRMRRLNLTPRVEWALEGGDKLSLETLINVNRFRNDAPSTVTTLIGDPPPVPLVGNAMRADAEDVLANLNWTRELASGATLEAKLGVKGENSDNVIRRRGLDPFGQPATDGAVDTRTRERELNSTGKYVRKLNAGHVMAFGWDGGASRRDDVRVERDAVRVFPPGLALDEDFDGRVTRLALYAQDEWNITPQWSMYLGARWEGIRTRVNGSVAQAVDNRSNVWSPVMQTLWKIPGKSEGVSDALRLALSRTFKAPTVQELIPRRNTWENNSATEADYQGNPDLRPELAVGIDAGYEHYWEEGAMMSIGGSLRRLSDYIGNQIYFDGYRWVFTPVNDGHAETRTLQLETKFPLKSLIEGAPAIDLRASVSRHWSRVTIVPGPNNRLERQTPLSANAGIDWRSGRLSAGASVGYVRNGLVRVTANRTFSSAARTDLGAYAAWKFTPKQELRVALSNLRGQDDGFDVSYADPLRGVEQRRWRYPGTLRTQLTYEVNY